MKIKDDSSFWRTALGNYKEVKTWPKEKQKFIISAESAQTGRFIKEKSDEN